MQRKQLDATDYLNTREVKEMLYEVRKRVVEKMKSKHPKEIEDEVQRQQQALKEELMSDLPDQYLSPQELKEREERQRLVGPPDEE